jgi:hypothetical protein
LLGHDQHHQKLQLTSSYPTDRCHSFKDDSPLKQGDMRLNLFRTTTIGEIKKQFGHYFRFLKLEFYYSNAKVKEPADVVPDHITVESLPTLRKEGVVSFHPGLTAMEFVQMLADEFGLFAQVFYQSGELWLETNLLEDTTLEKSNAMAEFACKPRYVNLVNLFL